VNQVALVGVQGSRKLAVATTQMNDQAAFHPGLIENLAGQARVGGR